MFPSEERVPIPIGVGRVVVEGGVVVVLADVVE